MINDQELLATVRNALITALPDDTPHDVIEDAALNVVEVLHAPWFPAREKKIMGATNVNLRSSPRGTALGTVAKGTAVRAGLPENGWTPVLVHGWVSSEMLG